MEIKKFAAIDTGSNAVRLLFMNVIRDETGLIFRKSSLLRVPLRLGEDVFRHRAIQPDKIDRLIHIMQGFRHLMEAEQVAAYRACATSAMREAINGEEVIGLVRKHTGIPLELISGQQEAEILYSYKLNGLIRPSRSYLFVDIGGGSTEITLIRDRNRVLSRSFTIGTVRILLGEAEPDEFAAMKTWLKEITKDTDKIELIGSGGNINKIFKISGKKEGKALSYKELRALNRYFESFSVDDRIRVLGMNPDRADVIIPAAATFIKIMKWAKAGKIWVPKIGVADGLIRQLAESAWTTEPET